MTPGDVARMPIERRRLLVRTAAQEFASAGYERASLNRIIQACGLSKSSFYHVIASKRELFELVVRDLAGELAAAMRVPSPSAFAGPDFWLAVERLMADFMRAAQTDDSFAALGRMFYSSGAPDNENAVAETLVIVEAWLHDVIKAGRASGTVRDDLPVELQTRLVFAVLRALDEWSVANLHLTPSDEFLGLTHAQLAVLRRLLEPDRA